MRFLLIIGLVLISHFVQAQVIEYLYLEEGEELTHLKKIKLDTSQIEDATTYAHLIASASIFQENHRLQRRASSNDAYANLQTYLKTINIEKVWDKFTGGLSRSGKEIIIAIVDDGIDTLHEDLRQNIYINAGEIKWNGMDDDGNGYIDDYYGWNGADSTAKVNSLYGGTHGTAIAGIIGARGNNDTGITGINWNTKLLNLSSFGYRNIGGDYSVANCFEYILANKKIYNQSNGSKGINTAIVSLSIGIEDEFPVDNPIWCAYLDSFALYGIMVSNAAPNSPKNIDITGDIPSTCLSRNLITVNNGKDKIANNSAYGTTHIDIAADGLNVLTTAAPSKTSSLGPYSYVNGASYSSPQVAGVMALILEAACNTFHQHLIDSTEQAIELFRKWVLTGDTLLALKNYNAIGGSLNAYKVLLAMDKWCLTRDITYNTKRISSRNMYLFPNPTSSGSVINLSIPHVSAAQASIISNAGKVVFQGLLNQSQWKLPALKSGVYQVHIQQNQRTYHSKLLIL